MELRIFSLTGIGEIRPGDDLASVIASAAPGALRDGDILAVTSKIVSKAEGRFVSADDREQAITDETVRVVATREHPGGTVRIVENRLGIIAAAAGVDNSNVPPGTVLLLPVDPDQSARHIRRDVQRQLGIAVGVIVTDTLGRPWRMGQTDAAIGIAGVPATLDLRGAVDDHGQEMRVTVTAVVDEIAAAADLVKGKTSGCPVAVVRGLGHLVSDHVPADQDGASVLIRPRDEDMFHLGAAESWNQGYRAALRDHGLPDPQRRDGGDNEEQGRGAGPGTRSVRTGG